MTTTTLAPAAPAPAVVPALVPDTADTTTCIDCGAVTPDDEITRTDCRDDADRCGDCASQHTWTCWGCSTEAAATAD